MSTNFKINLKKKLQSQSCKLTVINFHAHSTKKLKPRTLKIYPQSQNNELRDLQPSKLRDSYKCLGMLMMKNYVDSQFVEVNLNQTPTLHEHMTRTYQHQPLYP